VGGEEHERKGMRAKSGWRKGKREGSVRLNAEEWKKEGVLSYREKREGNLVGRQDVKRENVEKLCQVILAKKKKKEGGGYVGVV